MTVVPLRPLAQAQADAMNYGIGFSLGEKRIDPHDVYWQTRPSLLAPGRVHEIAQASHDFAHTVDAFVAPGTVHEVTLSDMIKPGSIDPFTQLGTVAETVATIAEQLQARRKKAQQDEIERLYRELTEFSEPLPWPFPAPPAPPAVPAALAPTPSAEPERPHIPIDEMTLADYRRGIANVWRSYHGA